MMEWVIAFGKVIGLLFGMAVSLIYFAYLFEKYEWLFPAFVVTGIVGALTALMRFHPLF